MTERYFPFDAGSGANVTEAEWRLMASQWLTTGVIDGYLNELAVSQRAAGADKSVDVATGGAWVKGHYYETDALLNKSIASNASGNPRIDRIVVRADFVANTVTVEVLEGTPAASPAAPSLTQTTSRWEISLAQVAVANGFASILTANITDERTYCSAPNVQTRYTLVAESLLAIDTASFDIQNISGGVHLDILAELRGTTGAATVVPWVRFNNDTGANYYDFAAGAGATKLTGNTVDGASATANYFSGVRAWVPGYTAADRYRTLQIMGMRAGSGTGTGGGQWANAAAAISRVTLLPDANNWLAKSRLGIYTIG